MSSEYVVHVEDATFQQVVLEQSHQKPVVVDFWAPWCGPCRTLGPVLEELAQEYQGRLIVAKLNTEQHQQIAAQLGIRSIPTVKAFYQGKLINEFSGALPRHAIVQFFDALLPKAHLEAYQAGMAALERNELSQAAAHFAACMTADTAAEDGGEGLAYGLLGQAQIAIREQDAQKAADLLENLPKKIPFDVMELVTTLKGQVAWLHECEQAAGDDQHPLAKAKCLASNGEYEQALECALQVAQADRTQLADARSTMVTIFSLMDKEHPAIRTYRSKLSNLLF